MNDGHKIIIGSDSGIRIRSFNDISDVIGGCIGAVFDLRSGLAGEAFQRFVNYGVRVAIVLADPNAYGERFGELAYEHRSHNMIRFVCSIDEAHAWLALGL